MIWMVKNIKDERAVLKHKKYDRYYVGDLITDGETELYTTEDLEQAYKVLEATKYHWSGINVDGWRVVEAPG